MQIKVASLPRPKRRHNHGLRFTGGHIKTQPLNTEVETFLTDGHYINLQIVLLSLEKIEHLCCTVGLISLSLTNLMVYFRDEETFCDSLVKGSYET